MQCINHRRAGVHFKIVYDLRTGDIIATENCKHYLYGRFGQDVMSETYWWNRVGCPTYVNNSQQMMNEMIEADYLDIRELNILEEL